MKALEIWNGRGFRFLPTSKYAKNRSECRHVYVCAHSRADAVRLINEAAGFGSITDNEVKIYYAEGAWGNSMDGVTPERGVWVTWTRDHCEVPERIL